MEYYQLNNLRRSSALILDALTIQRIRKPERVEISSSYEAADVGGIPRHWELFHSTAADVVRIRHDDGFDLRCAAAHTHRYIACFTWSPTAGLSHTFAAICKCFFQYRNNVYVDEKRTYISLSKHTRSS